MDTLSIIADVAGIMSSIAVVISILFIAYQTYINNKLSKAANTQALVELSMPFNMLLIQDPAVLDLWENGAATYDQLPLLDKKRYETILTVWLIHHENIFYQKTQGLLDEASYRPWNNDLLTFIRKQRLELVWNDELKSAYQAEFVEYIDAIMKQLNRFD